MKITEFERLDFFDSYIARVTIVDDRIEILAQNLGVLPIAGSHSRGMRRLSEAKLVFDGVTRSCRTVSEYVDSVRREGIKPAYQVQDGPFPPAKTPTMRFHLEGVQIAPAAWVDWEIESARFVLVSDEA